MKPKHKLKPTFGRRVMKLVCLLLGLMLGLMVGVTAYFQHQINQGQIQPQEALPTLQKYVAENLSYGETESDSGLIGGKGSGIVNILLIGQDREEGEERARSDSMILCSFNKKTKQLTMTSFLRDLYVKIPGFGSNRINAAYTFGGMELLDRTIRENFGVYIDANVEVDFAQFAQIVDTLGGVEIELRADEAAHITQKTGIETQEGKQLLNGEQALTYSRIRKLDADGDFARTNRQRKVLSAVIDTYEGAGLGEILDTVDVLFPMVNTDINPLEMVKYVVDLFPVLSGEELVSQRIPADGAYENRSIDGMSVLVADLDAARQMLRTTLIGE